MPPPPRHIGAGLAWRIAVTALAYFLGARLGQQLTVPGTNVGVFWPPAGISLALMLAWGTRTWPGVALGSFPALVPGLVATHGLWAGIGIAAGETVANVVPTVLAAVWVTRALGGADPLQSARGVARFVLWGGVAAQGVAAAMGVAWLRAAGAIAAEVAPSAALHWWLSNVVSVCVLAPLCLAWWPPLRLDHPGRHGLVYAVAIAAGLAGVGLSDPALLVHLRFVTILLVIGAAFQLGTRGVTATAAVLSALAIWGVASGRERLELLTVDRHLLLLNFYMATLALTGLAVAAVLREREKGAGELAEREALLRHILDASPLPISWAGAGDRIEFWNARAEALFGWRLEDLPTLEDWYRRAYPDPAYRAEVVGRWERSAAEALRTGGDIVSREVEVTCRDGSTRTVDIVGRFTGGRMLAIFSDLTERRRAEAQREELRMQLAQAQRVESVGRLAGGVAHDLNNLLAPILGLADLLLQEAPAGTSQAEDLAEIKRAAERARDLTRQLLAFGRKQVLEMRELDLAETLRGLERLLRRAIREDVRLELRLPVSVGRVRADAGQVEQVVMNLAVNAQQAMPEGGLLTITLADVGDGGEPLAEALPGAWVMLEVCDTGVGMERAVLERAFEPFFTTRRTGEGTGLGLSIVHGIVSQHGGLVLAESQPGLGSRLRVLLPRVGEGAPAPVDEAPPAAPAARGAGLILVVEDEEAVRDVTVRMLERMGYQVLSAPDADGAVRAAQAAGRPIDLLLTDVVMPGLNGRALHERLAAGRPGLRVLYMSGYAGDVVTQRGVLHDGLDLIQKPFTSDALAEAVRRALGDPAAAPPA
jgi:PAS domain S-box-containing protein